MTFLLYGKLHQVFKELSTFAHRYAVSRFLHLITFFGRLPDTAIKALLQLIYAIIFIPFLSQKIHNE